MHVLQTLFAEHAVQYVLLQKQQVRSVGDIGDNVQLYGHTQSPVDGFIV